MLCLAFLLLLQINVHQEARNRVENCRMLRAVVLFGDIMTVLFNSEHDPVVAVLIVLFCGNADYF